MLVPKGQSVNVVLYLDVINRLIAPICPVWQEYRDKGCLRLLHDNAPAHRITLITDFSIKNGIFTTNYSPHLPDLTS